MTRRAAARSALLLVGLALLVVERRGYMFVGSAATVLVLLIRHAMNPALLAGDWFLSLPGVYHRNFVRLVAFLASRTSLESVFLVGHVVSMGLILLGLSRLARTLFPRRQGVFLLSVALLVGWGSAGLGENVLIDVIFTAAAFASGIALLGIAEFVAGRPVRAAFLLGVATAFHLLVGGVAMLAVAVALAAGSFRPRGLRTLAESLAAYLVFASFTLVPIVLLRGRLPAVLSSAEYLAYFVGIRHPYLRASSWSIAEWTTFLFPFALGMWAARGALRREPGAGAGAGAVAGAAVVRAGGAGAAVAGADAAAIRRAGGFVGAMALVCLASVFFVEVVPVKEAAQLELFRDTFFARAIAVLFAAAYLLGRDEHARWPARLLLFLLVAATGHRLMIPAALLLLATDRNLPRIVAAGAGLLGVAIAVAAIARRFVPGVPEVFAIPGDQIMRAIVPMGILIVVSLAAGNARLGSAGLGGVTLRGARLASGALAVLVVAAAQDVATGSVRARIRTTIPASIPLEIADWARACDWVRRETPRGATFVTPPYRSGFRLLAERPMVADFKDNPFTDAGLVEWRRRLEELAGGRPLACSGFEECEPLLREGYASLDAAALRAIGARYGAWGCVVEREVPGLPVLHSEAGFWVCRLGDSASAASPPVR